MAQAIWLDDHILSFPAIDQALTDPNGLLAVGGDLSPARLLLAYRSGIFPWYESGQPILWWSPEPRAVIKPQQVKISRSLRKRLKRNEFEVRLNTNFSAVITGCAAARLSTSDTWITDEMQNAYLKLHQLGHAHSIECYKDDQLVGGLYGVSIGRLFFGESMFHTATDASKVAFVYLCRLLEQQQCPLIDCQLENPHLLSLGCNTISRQEFKPLLASYTDEKKSIDWRNLPPNLPDW
ncbi:MAG: leucyl/phenylalanyl-tRNA--protein transferase [Pseudomonadales bacterium]|nr:leucyl/phenylalanyl-tRNA--protein transferase [Pseudomonadales bacterium]